MAIIKILWIRWVYILYKGRVERNCFHDFGQQLYISVQNVGLKMLQDYYKTTKDAISN